VIVTSIASGSSGNATVVCGERGCIIIDNGISFSRLTNLLTIKNISLEKVNALLVTHGHSDHASGIPVFKKYTRIKVYGTYETSDIYVQERGGYGEYQEMGVPIDVFLDEKDDLEISGLQVRAVRVSHDARHPVAYFIQEGNSKFGVITDLGDSDILLEREIRESKLVFIEANHDVNLLLNGKYPEYLKKRIRNPRGHLSNWKTGMILSRTIDEGMNIALAHLSKVNNTPQLAVQTVYGILREGGFKLDKLRALTPFNDPMVYLI